MHSRDLVHWKIVNYVYDCLDDSDIHCLKDGKNAYGKGQWATSLRYHDGTFYALFITNEKKDNSYLYSTEDIVKGPWKRVELPWTMHDASLLFDDDGRVYSIWGNGKIFIAELEPDCTAMKKGTAPRLLFEAPSEGYMLRAEGSRAYHIGDWYYVLVIDWPAGGVRTETCWRSRSLEGPWESRTVLSGAFDGRKDGVAQGAIVDTPDGNWYALMFQDHGAVGRIPTLQRVTWTDGWPVLGDNGTPEKTFAHTLPLQGGDYVWSSDEFESDSLALVWQWNHRPDNSCWSLSERPGWLRLRACGTATSIMDARNTITQRTVGPRSTVETALDVSGLQSGDYAGLCAFQSRNASIGAEVDTDGEKYIVLKATSPEGRNKWHSIDIYREKLKGTKAYLRISYDFDSDSATFSFSFNGIDWVTLDYVLHMRYTLDLFTGYRNALFCYSKLAPGGYADFEWFHQRME